MNAAAYVVSNSANRMKARKEHVVPLSGAALSVLQSAARLRKGIAAEPIFPGLKGRPFSAMTILKTLRTAIGGIWTVHGLRSSFRAWAAEATAFSSEGALAHVIPSKVVKHTSVIAEVPGQDFELGWR